MKMKPALTAVNDFVVKFANVNGSGSASANELFARSILRMGVPVSPRNIFPSNIQGLPTWYEVRVTERGWLGRRGGVDLMVAMNPQTWNQDMKEIETGGYVFYDNTKVLPKSRFREDVNAIGMPLTEICNSTYTDARERQLFKNIIYVGALAGMMDIEPGVIAELIGEQYKGKEKLLKPNLNALQLGLNYAREHWTHSDENPPVGLILCAQKDHAVAKYALEGLPNKVMAAEYRTVLPDEKTLAEEIERTRKMLERRRETRR